MKVSRVHVAAAAAAAMLAIAPIGAIIAQKAPTVVPMHEWTVPWEKSRPRDPFVAPDGMVFFVAQAGNYIARLDPKTGAFKRYELEPGTLPHNCLVAPNGIVWFTGNGNGTLGRLDPKTGKITTYAMPDPALKDPHTLLLDKTGNLWFTAQNSNFIGHFDAATGKIRVKKLDKAGARPYGIAADSKGKIWFNMFGTNAIATIDADTWEVKTYALPEKAMDRRIAITSDDKIWYTDYTRGSLGRLDPVTSKVDEWVLPGGIGSMPYGMAVDDKDRLWVAETGKQPNRLVGFDPATKSFFSVTNVESGGGTIRHMVFDKKTKLLWFGTDNNTIGKADVALGTKTAM